MKKRIAFIINPISGGKNKDDFPAMVKQYINPDFYSYELFYTKSTAHNKEVAQNCVEQKYDIIVAVGGDGTINNTAKFITGTDIIFGIIPQGSGNGLARHLKITDDVAAALGNINKLNTMRIDTGMANNNFFINVAGVGFDAHVSWLFANAPQRGFWQYAKITFKEFSSYKPRNYQVHIDDSTLQVNAFLICAANGSQYGNNAYIAPLAIVNDGIFEITIIESFSFFQALLLGFRMFNKTLHQSPAVKIFSGKKLVIKRNKPEVVNIDGEAVGAEKDVTISINPSSLNVIIP